jgi:hypothetical protein
MTNDAVIRHSIQGEQEIRLSSINGDRGLDALDDSRRYAGSIGQVPKTEPPRSSDLTPKT